MSPEKEIEIKVKRVLPLDALKLNLDKLKLNESADRNYNKPKEAIEYKMKMKIGSETYNS